MPRKKQWMKKLRMQNLEDKGNVTGLDLHDDHQVQEGHLNDQEAEVIIVKEIATALVLTAS